MAVFLLTIKEVPIAAAMETLALTISDVRNELGELKYELQLAAERVKYRHARTAHVNQRVREELPKHVNSR